MSMFRAKKLDLGCFVNVRTLRDHTKRKVFEQNETERCANSFPDLEWMDSRHDPTTTTTTTTTLPWPLSNPYPLVTQGTILGRLC